MSRAFYPFVEEHDDSTQAAVSAAAPAGMPSLSVANSAARIAVYDDLSAAPRVVIIDPQDTRSYLEEITSEFNRLSHEVGGTIPFMVIREVVENLIHAYFMEPAISILDNGNTIRFADQGPGIKEKERALEYGTTSATEEMKRYIRGVGSGLPYAQQYLKDHGGTLVIEDNIASGTIVTISMAKPVNKPVVMAPVAAAEPAVVAPVVSAPAIQLTAREQQIIDYLEEHESVGPKELMAVYGRSQSTWTRELQALESQGIIAKQGQKRFLTAAGRALLG